MYPQVAIRPPGMLMCLEGAHPFLARPSYKALAHLPVAERAAQMRRPEIRERILGEATGESARLLRLLFIEGK